MQIQSFAHLDLIINGFRFSGYADDDPPITWDTEDLVEKKMGADGGMYVLSKPTFAEVMTIKLFPTSPATQWCIQQRAMRDAALIDKGPVTPYNGSFSDAVQGSSWELAGGWLENVPLVAMPNVTYEVMFGWQRITPNVDGGTYNPPLAVGA